MLQLIIHRSARNKKYLEKFNYYRLLQIETHKKMIKTTKISVSQLTTNDKINDRTRSPHSLLVSCPNWYRAPRNLRNLVNSLDVSVKRIGVTACGVDAADDVCGGVVDPPF